VGSSNGNKGSRRGRKPNPEVDTGTWVGFVDIPLGEEEKLDVAQLADSSQYDLLELVSTLLDQGYKLSVSPHKDGRSFIASLTGRLPDCPNYGYTLSGFGPDFKGCLTAVLYKHLQLCGGGVWAEQTFTTRQQLTLWG